jgi:nitrous oxide reductase
MNQRKREDGQIGRRQFLKSVLIGSGAAAIAVASGGTNAAPETQAPAAAPAAKPQGYHVTPHILEYYKTAQF